MCWCCPGPGPPWPICSGCAEPVWRRPLLDAAGPGMPVLGVCGGYQMLAEDIDDTDRIRCRVGGRPRPVADHGDLQSGEDPRPTGRRVGRARRSMGYEIHHGTAHLAIGGVAEPFLDGYRHGSVWGTMWHGAFENDGFRRAWLTTVTAAGRRPFHAAPGAIGFGDETGGDDRPAGRRGRRESRHRCPSRPGHAGPVRAQPATSAGTGHCSSRCQKPERF